MLKDYSQLKAQFFNSSLAAPEVQKVAADIQRQNSFLKFLPGFVEKNGIPKWDKAIFKVENKAGSRQNGSNAANRTNSADSGAQGVFFIPLQSTTSSEIKSYITAYKHADSFYTYRLYNRDSLNNVHPSTNELKKNLLNTQAVFGVFEKSVNGKDSILIQSPVQGKIKNATLSIGEPESGGRNANTNRSGSLNRATDCSITLTISIEYSLEMTFDGTTLTITESFSMSLEITIDCSGGGGGGCSCGSDYISGGGDPISGGNGGNWWNWGTGWPWNNNGGNGGGYSDLNWYWWWTGGGGGSGSGFSPTVDYLSNNLRLSWIQSLWLSQNPTLADQIYNYLITTTEPAASQIAFEHLNAMMTNATYLSFVENHALTGNANSVWWEDDAWLSDPSNINFDLDAINGLAYQPNPAEKALLKKYPVAGALIFSNKFVAENYTINYMGYNGLNDKSDAFRHCFYQTINTADVLIGPTITKLFSDAHETSTPPQLDLEKQMDLFNNSVGIAYGNTVGFFTSYSTIADEIKNNKIPNGELKYLKPLDANNNIIPGQTQLFFTNQ